jgi:hypothetical protein
MSVALVSSSAQMNILNSTPGTSVSSFIHQHSYYTRHSIRPHHTIMAFFNQQPPTSSYETHPSLQFYGQPSAQPHTPYGYASTSEYNDGADGLGRMNVGAGSGWNAAEGRWWHAFGTGGFEGEPSLMEGTFSLSPVSGFLANFN